MVLYIHGFGGSGKGQKATLFKKHYEKKGIKYFSPSLSYVPDLAISTLEDFIKIIDEEIFLIGSSLGGFYAIYLATKFDLKAALINPSTKPLSTLPKGIEDGFGTNFYDLSRFEITKASLNYLKKYTIEPKKQKNFLLLLQKDDEVIDYKIAKEQFRDAKKIITLGGGHSFFGIEEYFEQIDSFFGI